METTNKQIISNLQTWDHNLWFQNEEKEEKNEPPRMRVDIRNSPAETINRRMIFEIVGFYRKMQVFGWFLAKNLCMSEIFCTFASQTQKEENNDCN